MSTTLRVSVYLNCALLGCLAVLLLSGRREQSRAAAPAEADRQPPATEAATPTPASPPAAETRPFHWSQIESADYHTYIANLRGIGCPEQTIRDIITADVESLYAARRRPLEAKLATESSAGRLAVQRELQELRQQEASFVAALVGAASVSTEPGSVAEFPPSGSVQQEPPGRISLPLVFQAFDPSAIDLTAEQVQVIDDLRARFTAGIGGLNQDPNDPAYRERWLSSQPEVDQDLRGMIGNSAYQHYQLAVRPEAEPPAPSGP